LKPWRSSAGWFKPLRRLLGIEAFGVAAWVAGAGEPLVVDHAEEGEDGQEELYLVLSGSAEFMIGEAVVVLTAGGCVAVRPGVQRSARAGEPDTVVLAVGAPLGRAFRAWGWEYSADALPYWRRGDYEQAATVYAGALDQYPDSPHLLYNLACCEALAGRREEALDHLAQAIALLPRMRSHAQTDDDLGSIRDDPRFPAAKV
jgi:tetratricopeptide (TPR) repeat protein